MQQRLARQLAKLTYLLMKGLSWVDMASQWQHVDIKANLPF